MSIVKVGFLQCETGDCIAIRWEGGDWPNDFPGMYIDPKRCRRDAAKDGWRRVEIRPGVLVDQCPNHDPARGG